MTQAQPKVSPGLWALAWRRLRGDRIAMGALAVVLAFLLMLVLSVTGILAKDWDDEVGVNYGLNTPPPLLGGRPGGRLALVGFHP